jgi:hypothetical protein
LGFYIANLPLYFGLKRGELELIPAHNWQLLSYISHIIALLFIFLFSSCDESGSHSRRFMLFGYLISNVMIQQKKKSNVMNVGA